MMAGENISCQRRRDAFEDRLVAHRISCRASTAKRVPAGIPRGGLHIGAIQSHTLGELQPALDPASA